MTTEVSVLRNSNSTAAKQKKSLAFSLLGGNWIFPTHDVSRKFIFKYPLASSVVEGISRLDPIARRSDSRHPFRTGPPTWSPVGTSPRIDSNTGNLGEFQSEVPPEASSKSPNQNLTSTEATAGPCYWAEGPFGYFVLPALL